MLREKNEKREGGRKGRRQGARKGRRPTESLQPGGHESILKGFSIGKEIVTLN